MSLSYLDQLKKYNYFGIKRKEKVDILHEDISEKTFKVTIDTIKAGVEKIRKEFAALIYKSNNVDQLKKILQNYEKAEQSFLNRLEPLFNKLSKGSEEGIKRKEYLEKMIKDVFKKDKDNIQKLIKRLEAEHVTVNVGNKEAIIPSKYLRYTARGLIVASASIIASLIFLCAYTIYKEEKERKENELRQRVENFEQVARAMALKSQINALKSSGNNFKLSSGPDKVQQMVLYKIRTLETRRMKLIKSVIGEK